MPSTGKAETGPGWAWRASGEQPEGRDEEASVSEGDRVVPPALLWGVRRYLAAPQAGISSWRRQPLRGGLSGSTLEYWHLRLRQAGLVSTLTLVYKRGAVVSGAFLAGAPRREALVYAHLAPQLPLALPAAVAFDTQTGDLWFLPFPPGRYSSHWQADWGTEEVLAVLDDLARLHAAFWEAPALRTWSWLLQPTDRDAAMLLDDGRRGLEALVAEEAYDESLTPGRVAQWLALARAPEGLLTVLQSAGRTLLHGDAGFQNVLITSDGRRLWYDWQLAAVGPPALDLATFLHPWYYPEAEPPLAPETMVTAYLARLAGRGHALDPTVFQHQLEAALLWRWLIQWAPLLGLYRQRLRPEVRQRLYHGFERLHWPILARWAAMPAGV
jgi:hypothetical protein